MSAVVSKERTKNYLRQVQGSVLYKAGAVIASFIAIPIMIDYLGVEQFGVWSTILTVMAWIVFFDLGIGNGLKNRVSEALAKNDNGEASKYISAGYSLIGIISFVLWVFCFFCAHLVPWQGVFNTDVIAESTLRYSVQIALSFVLLNFWVGLISAVLGGFQKTSLVALGQLYSNVASLVLVGVAWVFISPSIIVLATIYGVATLGANCLLSFSFYKANQVFFPRYLVSREYVSPLLSMGLRFFAIQVAVLVVFTTDKILITQFFGPQEVTQYEVIMKLFGLFSFAHALISAPLWPAYADAFHRKDKVWIGGMLTKQLLLFIVFVVGVLVMMLIVDRVVSIWVGDAFSISYGLVIAVAVFIVVSIWNNIFAMILNGIGKTNVQLVSAVLAMLVNIPLAFVLVKILDFGVGGVVMAAVISLSFSAICLPLQVFYLLKKENF